jgi:lysophospholipase L1-like esterase
MTDDATRLAREIGRQRASHVIALRKRAQPRRARALAQRAANDAAVAGPGLTLLGAHEALVGASHSAGLLLAEGDSWFDYPLNDVLKSLEDEHGFDVESLAHAGDSLENMAYADGQLDNLSRRLERMLRDGRVPKAILLSGGGNDVAGPEFGMLLNHAGSKLPPLNDQVVAGVVDQRMRLALVTMIEAISQICIQWLTRPLPILLHGYDYPVPDGRGVFGGWGPLPGPWLAPGFGEKGYAPGAARTAIAAQLIDRLNQMLAGVAALPDFGHVGWIDLRGTLSNGKDYKKSWDNELHPTSAGFDRVALHFAAAINRI